MIAALPILTTPVKLQLLRNSQLLADSDNPGEAPTITQQSTPHRGKSRSQLLIAGLARHGVRLLKGGYLGIGEEAETAMELQEAGETVTNQMKMKRTFAQVLKEENYKALRKEQEQKRNATINPGTQPITKASLQPAKSPISCK